ncbi:hypothetical protein [Solemya velesiana gill symbiont]|uniref:Uncharacterized protein n=1 Tax=Solemya velesiana gill symbiont TaxID=1918948 RepID=A0A1T2KTA9_9GAMM|nr:hypothetical protein [Solemya velesiana gill symbiont]OOZ36098.1 hypothetical protein BOW51_08895 [Solemya velesiana gill symbiont]
MANLHQINVQFNPQEDRLVLSVRADDNSEIKAWLTRRYTRLLLGILGKLATQNQAGADSADAQQAMQSFQRDAALEGADFETEYDQSATTHPLGEEPVLVTKIEYKPTGDLIALALGLPDGRNINLNLTKDLLFVFIKLLEEGAAKAEWDLVAASEQDLEMAQTKPAGVAIH